MEGKVLLAKAESSISEAYGEKEAELIGTCATAAIIAVLLLFAVIPLFLRKRNPPAKNAAPKD